MCTNPALINRENRETLYSSGIFKRSLTKKNKKCCPARIKTSPLRVNKCLVSCLLVRRLVRVSSSLDLIKITFAQLLLLLLLLVLLVLLLLSTAPKNYLKIISAIECIKFQSQVASQSSRRVLLGIEECSDTGMLWVISGPNFSCKPLILLPTISPTALAVIKASSLGATKEGGQLVTLRTNAEQRNRDVQELHFFL